MGDIHPAPSQFTADQLTADPILRYFHFAHLPPVLREISEPFCALAGAVIATLPRNAERSVALRKLLEAKDAAVRSNVPDPQARKETFYDRLLAESKDLEARKEKLAAFMETFDFANLPADQRSLLDRQFNAMSEYAGVLGQRIATITPPGDEFPVEGEVQVRNGDQSEKPIPFDG